MGEGGGRGGGEEKGKGKGQGESQQRRTVKQQEENDIAGVRLGLEGEAELLKRERESQDHHLQRVYYEEKYDDSGVRCELEGPAEEGGGGDCAAEFPEDEANRCCDSPVGKFYSFYFFYLGS